MTEIAYCNLTINPCPGCSRVKVSRGCDHCYAEKLAWTRLLHLAQYAGLTNPEGHWTGKIGWNPKALDQIRRLRNYPAGHVTKGKPWLDGFPKIAFIGDMGDLFAIEVDSDKQYELLYEILCAAQRGIRFIILSKRYESMVQKLEAFAESRCCGELPIAAGFSVCTQADADRAFPLLPRLAEIVEVPFLSLEPLLEPINMRGAEAAKWIIVGGESGAKARRLDTEWVDSTRNYCREHKIPFFFKQWGARTPRWDDQFGMPMIPLGPGFIGPFTEMPLAWRPK